MDEQELKALVKFGERRDVEIKGPGSVDDLLFSGRVARAALALSNHRDGGFIIIGAVQIAGSASFELSGMNAAQLARWRNKDVVLDKLGPYGAPQIVCELEHVPVHLGCAAIRVQQFAGTPVICTKDYTHGDLKLRRGALYCRPAGGKPRSVTPENPEQMQEVLDIAIEIGIRRFFEPARAADIVTGGPAPAASNDAELFRKQRGEL